MGFSVDSPVVRISKGIGYLTALLTLIFGISRIWDAASAHFANKKQVSQLLAAGEVQRAGSDYRGAWETFEKAAVVKATPEVVHAQEDLAMEWLRRIKVPEGQTFTAIVNKVSPALINGVLKSDGARKADLLAHLGWGDYLRYRENQRELRPDHYFDEALKADSSNVFAHAFKGFWIIWSRGALPEASAQFRLAVDSKREREMVRELQFAALFNFSGLEESEELLRVCAEMVRNSETIPRELQRRVFSYIYWSSRQDAEMRERFLKALDIQDHLKMYQTLFGSGVDSAIYSDNEILRDFWLATLLERAGKTPEALTTYRQVKTRFDEESEKRDMFKENYIKITDDAIRRLSAASPNR
jgi:tetratricopeptide (TPR) repeat protein